MSASLIELSPNTVYHYRVVTESVEGLGAGADEAATTLASSETGEAKTPAETAEATDGGLSVKASGGTGQITVGPYGSNIGGLGLTNSSGAYFQVYHSASASFKEIEYKDCELGGARALWWDNPNTGWEPISKPTAVYTESPEPCITVTATESTTPSIAQLSDPRHVGGPAGTQEFGQCRSAKKGEFSDGACTKLAEKKGKPAPGKGKFEWYPAPSCYAMKHGHFGDEKCGTESFSENKKHEKKYKGKYEKGSTEFHGSGKGITLEAANLTLKGKAASLTCGASSVKGELLTVKNSREVITYTGCKLETAGDTASAECSSSGEIPGPVVTSPLEAYAYQDSEGHVYANIAGRPIMKFACGNGEGTFELAGSLSGRITSGDLNAMVAKSEAKFGHGGGDENVNVIEPTGAQSRATFTEAEPMTLEYAESTELYFAPPEPPN